MKLMHLIQSIVLPLLWAEGIFAAQSQSQQQVLSAQSKLSEESLLWGPYKPNVYFGVRPRIPNSLAAGLLWGRVNTYQDIQHNFRHTCEQHEGMTGYGWNEYDIRHGGSQVIHDAANTIDITTEFIKVAGGQHGGNWAVRVKGQPRDDAAGPQLTTVMFYTTLQGLGSIAVQNEHDELGIIGDVDIKGSTVELGDFSIKVTEGPDSNRHPAPMHKLYQKKPLDRTFVASANVPSHAVWQVQGVAFSLIKAEVEGIAAEYGEANMPPPAQAFVLPCQIDDGNVHIVQKVFEGAFEFDILYTSASASSPITSDSFDLAAQSISNEFTSRFDKIFAPKAPFDGDEKYTKFGQSMFSNLFGGIGYFHGDTLVDRSYAEEYEETDEGFWEDTEAARARPGSIRTEGPTELFTSIPSRPFFPRGFLWDEGFHLIPIMEWDLDVGLSIVESWFRLIDEDGWIGREQILGDEARAKVPQEFTTQYPHIANPPTLFLVLETFVDKLSDERRNDSTNKGSLLDPVRSAMLENKELALEYLRKLYPLLRRHYLWFRRTQRGDITTYDREAYSSKEAYRWRGRTPRHILASGLDDYPRAQPPHPGELHLDLISWMGMMSRSLRKIANLVGEADDEIEYAGHEHAIVRNIDDLHWSARHQAFCDATIVDDEDHVHVCHKGYISLFPFLTGLLNPDSPRLGAVLDLMGEPAELWSEHGLRSLSARDQYYMTDENYWRSPVWININYLALKALQKLATTATTAAGQSNPHIRQATSLYNSLRLNLVNTVLNSWEETGFAWEQYHPETGKGQRTQHFTGWTSLIVQIMHMEPLPEVRMARSKPKAAKESLSTESTEELEDLEDNEIPRGDLEEDSDIYEGHSEL